MKKYFIITMSLFLFSCEKEVELNGTSWINGDGSILLEFTNTNCQCTHNPGNIGLERSGIYIYEYEYPNISMHVARSSGFFDYEGTVSKKKITLTEQVLIFYEDSSAVEDGDEEIFHPR